MNMNLVLMGGTLVWWAIGIGIVGAIFGSITDSSKKKEIEAEKQRLEAERQKDREIQMELLELARKRQEES